LWAKASLQYATAVVGGPGKVVACGWLFPLCFFAGVWLTFGPPYIGTDFSAYLKTEGNVADKNDAFEAAVVHESMSTRDARRLGEMAPPVLGAGEPEDREIDFENTLAEENEKNSKAFKMASAKQRQRSA
jgi:hypothetical protein